MPPTIIVVGSVNMDLVVRCERLPREGETVFGSDFQMIPGGKGANQAVAAARLGAKTFMAGRVGQDTFGEQLLGNLREEGIDVDNLRADADAPTGVALIDIIASGNNSIVVAPGANMANAPQDLDALVPALKEADALVVQLEVPLPVVERSLELAREHGATSVLDAGPAVECPSTILAKADVVSPNETEAEAITGIQVTDVASAERAARKLLSQGVTIAVLKLGESGALVANGESVEHVPGYQISPVDTTAAGDAFTASLALRLAQGDALPDATRYANAVGACACTKLGAQPAMPTPAEVEALIQSQKS